MLTIVTGPPCSGKTTYVQTHAQPGDVIIDYDLLAQTFGSPVTHGHSAAHRAVAAAARRAAIDVAIKIGDDRDIWIVSTEVSHAMQQRMAKVAARIITLSADAKELHRRAHAERPRAWHRLIDDWAKGRDSHTRMRGSREW